MGLGLKLEGSYGLAFLCSLTLHSFLITARDSASFTPGGEEGQRVNILLISKPSVVRSPDTALQTSEFAQKKPQDLEEKKVEALGSSKVQEPPKSHAFLNSLNSSEGRTAQARLNPSSLDSPHFNFKRPVEEGEIETGEDQIPQWLKREENSHSELEAGMGQATSEGVSVSQSKTTQKQKQGPGKEGGTRNFVPARFLNLSQPAYPFSEKKRNHEGSVLLEVSIDSSGVTQEVRILESSGYTKLDQVSISAIEAARISPALENGVPVASLKTIRFRYQIR
jgi:TonB family protein